MKAAKGDYKKRISTAVFVLALITIGFIGGYVYRTALFSPNAEMEDYALTNVLGVLGYSSYLEEGKTDQLRELLDINLNDHLTRIRQYQGNITNHEFMEAKIRTLNAASILWGKRPPFQSESLQPNDTNVDWIEEWREKTRSNFQLLEWARKQCLNNPGLKCKQSKKSNNIIEK